MNAGRKKTFDKEVALEQAMKVFWSNGFSGTSLSELTHAMNINKPSLYSTFGNKESLFLEAFGHYFEKYANTPNLALLVENQSLKNRIRNMLRGVVDVVCNPNLPGGCFFVLTLSESAGQCLPEPIVNAVKQVYTSSQSQIMTFFENEQHLGNISHKSSANVLTGYLLSIQLGIGNLGRSGVTKEEIHQIIDHSLMSFDFN